MGSATSLLLLGAALVAAAGALGVWFALKRPAQALRRRQRAEALAAADRYTPAERVSPYGSTPQSPAPDLSAPGLTDAQRVAAMRALLARGDNRGNRSSAARAAVAGTTMAAAGLAAAAPPADTGYGDDIGSTAPMAWQATMAPEDLEDTVPGHHRQWQDSDRAHITLF